MGTYKIAFRYTFHNFITPLNVSLLFFVHRGPVLATRSISIIV